MAHWRKPSGKSTWGVQKVFQNIDFTHWHRSQGVPTEHEGTTYRSKTEARWAVFFGALGIEYEYEVPVPMVDEDPHGLTGNADYEMHPDFWFPQVSTWAEVKSDEFDKFDTERVRQLAAQTGSPCVLLEGAPKFKEYRLVVSERLDAALTDGFVFGDRFGIGEAEVRAAALQARSAFKKKREGPITEWVEDDPPVQAESNVERLPEAGPGEMLRSAYQPYSHRIEKTDRDIRCTRCRRGIRSGTSFHRLPYLKLCDRCYSAEGPHDWPTRGSKKRGSFGGNRFA